MILNKQTWKQKKKVIFCFYKANEFVNLLESAKSHSHLVFSPSPWFKFKNWLIQYFHFISCNKTKHDEHKSTIDVIQIKEDGTFFYQGNLNVSFHQPCLEQFATILSSRIIISEKIGLILISGCQHSSINLHI